jgi:photosystem II stability/assembly factor-like uncharacterized protein
MISGRGLAAVLLIASLSACESGSDQATSNAGRLVSEPDLTSIQMTSRQIGWGTTATGLLRTTDGGKSWRDVGPTALAAHYVAAAGFRSATEAWVQSSPTRPTQPALGGHAPVWWTADGGRSWRQGGYPAAAGEVVRYPLRGGSLFFLNGRQGWRVETIGLGMNQFRVLVEATTDGGKSWHQVFVSEPSQPASGLPSGCMPSALTFKDQTNGWAAGTCPAANSTLLLVTHDGGTTWQPEKLQIPRGAAVAGCSCKAEAPIFFTSSRAVLTVDYRQTGTNDRPDPEAAIYVSDDGGASWRLHRPPSRNAGGIAFTDRERIWQLDEGGGTIYRSADGGQKWDAVIPNPSLGAHPVLDLVDTQAAWALLPGSNPSSPRSLLATSDGGQSWHRLLGGPIASIAQAKFSCQLPVQGLAPDLGAANQGGFVSFPSGNAAVDPDSTVAWVGPEERTRMVRAPALHGGDIYSSGSLSYHPKLRRWLPVSHELVSPDGRQYVYTIADITEKTAEPDPYPPRIGGHVHVVDVASGKDRVLLQGEYEAVAYTAEGIYVVAYNYYAARASYDAADGLWLADPVTGHLRQITAEGDWRTFGGGAFWSNDRDPADPNPWVEKIIIHDNRISRLDPGTGAVQPWFVKPGQAVEPLGFDAQGHPVVRIGQPGPPVRWEIWLVTAPGTGHMIYAGPLANRDYFTTESRPTGIQHALGDSHGIWFTGPAILLYQTGPTFSRLTGVNADVVGPCE